MAGDDGDGGGGGIGSESVAVVSDDGQNAVAGGEGVLVGVGIAESIEESFCLCGGSSAALSPVKEMVAVPEGRRRVVVDDASR